MSTKRLRQLLCAALLVVAALVVSRTLYNPGGATSSRSTYVGVGDLRRYEGAQDRPEADITAGSQPRVGMGDLRRYEYEQEAPNNR